MRKPRKRGKPIDRARFADWTTRFAGFDPNVSRRRITRWIFQFGASHRDIAARLLDAVEYYRNDQLSEAFRFCLKALPGWARSSARRAGRWRFVAFSRHAGESGDSMLHQFRRANELHSNAFDELFVTKADLIREDLGPDDTVVYVDDFVGTGNQATESWVAEFEELTPRQPDRYLVLAAATDSAISRIEKASPLRVISSRRLRASDNLFSDACRTFSDNEKRAILRYCSRADDKYPRGYGDCGLLVVFAHGCPNNSIPILHSGGGSFSGLFPR